jgi:hypothetical protein
MCHGKNHISIPFTSFQIAFTAFTTSKTSSCVTKSFRGQSATWAGGLLQFHREMAQLNIFIKARNHQDSFVSLGLGSVKFSLRTRRDKIVTRAFELISGTEFLPTNLSL